MEQQSELRTPVIPALATDPVYEKIREKHKEKQEKQAAKNAAKVAEHKEAVEKGEKKMVAERTETGLYYVRWEGGGAIAPVLKGYHTSIAKLRKLCEMRYGEGILR